MPFAANNLWTTPQDLTGQRFGRLIAQRIISRGPVVWECACDCGRLTNVPANALKQSNTTSCGCRKLEILRAAPELTRKRPYESLYNYFVTCCKRQVSISFEQFVEFTKTTNCHYCNDIIEWTKFNVHRNGMAYYLDRTDNSIDYTPENVVVCCTRCNKGESDQFSYEEWVEIGKCIRRMREDKQ